MLDSWLFVRFFNVAEGFDFFLVSIDILVDTAWIQ